MKRKRGGGKRKSKLAPVVGAKEAVPNIVSLNTQDDLVPDDFDNAEFDSRMEVETPQTGGRSRQQANLQKQKVIDATMGDSMSSSPEMSVAVSANLSKKARSIMTKSSRGFVASSIEPGSNAEQVQNGRTHQKEANSLHQDPQYEKQELKAALEVIKKVMKMDAAEPFNVPVDPVALAIPDYFDIIDTPMDFGTICSNIENGVKYKNSKDVLRDVQYIWDNCYKYNKKGHYILELMKRVKKNFTKSWTEAGLYREQQQEIDGHSDVPPTKSTMSCSIHGHRSPVGSMIDHARHQQQDHADPSGVHPHQPSLRYSQSYHPQQRPCQCQLSSDQHHTCQPKAGTNGVSAGHSHLLPPIESTMRRSPRGHKSLVGSMADNPSRSQKNQISMSQPQLHQHQPSVSCIHPYQTQERSCQCPPGSGLQQPFVGTNIANAGDVYSSPPEVSMIRCTKRGPRCSIGPMTDHISHKQQDPIPQSHMQPHQPSSSCVHEHHPQHGTCQGHLSSSQLHPSFDQPQPSQPHAAGAEMSSEGDFYSWPPEVSILGCTKNGPGCPIGSMADCVSHKQQDQITPRHMQPHQPSSSYIQEHHQHGSCRGQLISSQLHPRFEPPQPSQPHAAGAETSSAEEQSTPPTESIVRCTKRGPRFPVGPMIDYISHIAPIQMQPQQGTCQGNPSSSQPQPSLPLAGIDMGSADSTSIKRKTRGRGPTRCLDVWNTEDKIPIATNALGQPIGLEAPKLVNFLGTMARNGHLAPLNYVDWRAFPDENKEKMWQQVQEKFDIDPNSESWVLKSIGNKWKNWKALLKANHYNRHTTDEERLADRDERVLPDQWRILISFWNSKEAQERSVTNKASRAQQKTMHTTGTKSFARVREEQREKRPDGKEPSRAELFILTRTRKDGHPVNEASSVIISQLREKASQQRGTSQNGIVEDDVFAEVVGQDRHGRVRYLLGPSPSDLGGPKPSRAEAIRMVSEANVEVRELKNKMSSMEQTCAQMAAQMTTMMSMMSTMQKKSPEKHLPNAVGSLPEPLNAEQVADVSINSEGSQEVQVHSSSVRQGAPSLQKTATKRGRKPNKNVAKVTRKRR
ncbi:hypothetical protein CsSME_00010250 [Camellia sinensis var. sinensis]|uniref:bromodomain-containing protein 4-like isoform X2 n=1 Tax=Camellia sinensis TaxID=4442 RepID=UPI001035935A|nr:bromodomain-containing protein 4-like isoform X2 [Camellia sinensis]